ncbi:cytochrome P450 704C1-like isoform X1 [Rosa rugosa]|uniref:cytochrome P450 704C1-like isoform X1 n=1 Tax=Rosa rugosa TaxID=74645 RepID=UPI002B40AA14|nr:cytochrome P450 704C1-like isoform X1 [Rosa rugosa]
MVILYFIFAFTCLLLFLFITFLSSLILRIFTGKSIGDPSYPPVKGTVFHQLLYFTKLYDHQTQIARETPTYRLLSPNHSSVYTCDAQNIEHVLKTKFSTYTKGAYNELIMGDTFGHGIFVVDGEKWRQQRKLASMEFSTRILRDFSCSVFRRNAAKLVKVVHEFSDSNCSFDMQDLLMRCTLDSIFKVGFGIELNCLEESSKSGLGFMKAFDESTALTYRRYVDPFWKVKRFLNVGSEASLRKYVKVINDFVDRLIRSKRKLLAGEKAGNDKEDILSRFLVESEKDPEQMNDKYLSDIILNFMIAGKDTSANTLSWFFYMLSKNPLIQEKVAQEVMDVVGLNHEANIDEFVADITDAALEQMHYLHATLTETLRLYPAVPLDGRSAEVDDILPDGFRVKKGDRITYMAYAMGRMPYIWGNDAEDFRPERWLENGIFKPESPFKFVAFHAGPRICLGKDFAYRQMKIVAMALLCFFRFELADETKNVTYRTMFTLHMDCSLTMLAVPRKSLNIS